MPAGPPPAVVACEQLSGFVRRLGRQRTCLGDLDTQRLVVFGHFAVEVERTESDAARQGAGRNTYVTQLH